jgi:hypothetical protein
LTLLRAARTYGLLPELRLFAVQTTPEPVVKMVILVWSHIAIYDPFLKKGHLIAVWTLE